VEESFSNESLRAREGEGSSDASIVRHGNHSEIWEPARKSRLLSDNVTVPMKKRSTLDLRESTNGVGIHDTTVVNTSEITTFTCNVTAASEFTTAEDKTEDETTSKDESESAASINDIIAASQVLFAVDGSAEEMTLLAEKVSPLHALKPAGAIPIDETPITDASDEDVSEAPQVAFSVNGSTQEVTLPAEKVSSLDALKPAEAIPTDETPITDESDEAVSAAPSGSFAVDRSAEEITLLAKNGSSLDALKTAKAIGTDETTGDLIFMNDIKITTSSC